MLWVLQSDHIFKTLTHSVTLPCYLHNAWRWRVKLSTIRATPCKLEVILPVSRRWGNPGLFLLLKISSLKISIFCHFVLCAALVPPLQKSWLNLVKDTGKLQERNKSLLHRGLCWAAGNNDLLYALFIRLCRNGYIKLKHGSKAMWKHSTINWSRARLLSRAASYV